MCCTARQLVENANYASSKEFGNFFFSELAYNFPLLCPCVGRNVAHNNSIRTRRKYELAGMLELSLCCDRLKQWVWRRLLELGVSRRG